MQPKQFNLKQWLWHRPGNLLSNNIIWKSFHIVPVKSQIDLSKTILGEGMINSEVAQLLLTLSFFLWIHYEQKS